MSFLNTQLAKNMLSRLLRIRKYNKNMLFLNTLLIKNMSSQLFYDIINS